MKEDEKIELIPARFVTTPAPAVPKKPRESLLGETLYDGWTVTQQLSKLKEATGSHFSCGYIAEKDGKKAFVKAVDFIDALTDEDPMKQLGILTAAFNFERDLCYKCRASGLNKIVHPIAHGGKHLREGDLLSRVEYIIFERGTGDVRSHLASMKSFDNAFAFRSLHNISVGISQLHSVDVAHQDIKPSNVVVFDKSSKLADLGRASSRMLKSQYDDYQVAGDCTYAPPELLYNSIDPDWLYRRIGCDVYHLGSMVTFFFSGTPMTPLLFSLIDAIFHPDVCKESYDALKPILQNAFGQAIAKIKSEMELKDKAEVCEIIKELCNPDPKQRGDSKNIASKQNPFAMTRYISRFNYLASKEELKLMGKEIARPI